MRFRNKLWGTENGGSYGYYVNNVSTWSLTDPVDEGDYVNAFVYTDLTTWFDTYAKGESHDEKVRDGIPG